MGPTTSVFVPSSLAGEAAATCFARVRHCAGQMDLQMPDMDGLEATQQAWAREAAEGLPRTPIVAMTGANDAANVAACLEAGMDRFLSKPFGLAQLRRALDETVRDSNGRLPAAG